AVVRAVDPVRGIVASVTVTVTAARLVAIGVTPALPSIALGTTRQFVATGTYTDNTTQDLTAAVTWSSSSGAVATISNAGGSQGLATSASTGTTVITATDPGTSTAGSTTLTVFDDITFRSAASAGVASGTSLVISAPTGTAENDVLVAGIAIRPQTATVTPPSGWTLVRRLDNSGGAGNSLLVFTRVAGASEPSSYTWSTSSSTGTVGGIAAFRFVDTSAAVDAESGQTTASSLSHTAPSITTTTARTMLVTVHAFASAATWTSPAGMTEVADVASQAIGAIGISVSMHCVVQTSAGATGTRTAVAANDADTGNAAILALRRAP
ncbi:MAG: Ig-like domain-containing protein, partial [Planctomycetes bacterium]|nr:Ig-like domain-containing protein [Planctomycetota bacterium]